MLAAIWGKGKDAEGEGAIPFNLGLIKGDALSIKPTSEEPINKELRLRSKTAERLLQAAEALCDIVVLLSNQ